MIIFSCMLQVKIWFQNRRTKWKKQDNISNAEAAEHKNQTTTSKVTDKTKTKSMTTKPTSKPTTGQPPTESGSEDHSLLGESAESGSEHEHRSLGGNSEHDSRHSVPPRTPGSRNDSELRVITGNCDVDSRSSVTPRSPSRDGGMDSEDETSPGKLVIDTDM